MKAALAREIIAQALEDETYEGDIPEADKDAIEVANGLVEMARDAWSQNIKGAEVEAIIKLADRDGDDGEEEAKPKAKPGRPKAAPAKAKPEVDPRASDEPWDDYDGTAVKEIIEGIEVWAEAGEFDSVQHVLVYESANKNRVRIVNKATELLPEDMVPGDDAEPEPEEEPEVEPEPEPDEPEGDDLTDLDRAELKKLIKAESLGTLAELGVTTKTTDDEIRDIIRDARGPVDPEPEPEDEPEPEPEEPEAAGEPFEGYDGLKASDVKASLEEYLENEDVEADEKIDTINKVLEYEASKKNRTTLVDYFENCKSKIEEAAGGGDDEAGASAEEGEAEDAAAHEADAGDESSAPARPKPGKGSRDSAGEGAGGNGTGASSDPAAATFVISSKLGKSKIEFTTEGKFSTVGIVLDLIERGATSISVDAS